MKYFIEDIVSKQTGETNTGWKYPDRIGSEVTLISDLEVGKPLYFRYIKYNNGVMAEDHITRTSVVDDYDSYSKPGYLFIYTKNNIYTLKELE